jgi:hypothetical protein
VVRRADAALACASADVVAICVACGDGDAARGALLAAGAQIVGLESDSPESLERALEDRFRR